MSDLNFQQLSTVQNANMLKPVTMAAATTVAPETFLTILTGTTNITTITPPVTGSHLLCLAFSDASPGDILTTGNVLVGTTVITTNIPVLLVYDPSQAKYYLIP